MRNDRITDIIRKFGIYIGYSSSKSTRASPSVLMILYLPDNEAQDEADNDADEEGDHLVQDSNVPNIERYIKRIFLR